MPRSFDNDNVFKTKSSFDLNRFRQKEQLTDDIQYLRTALFSLDLSKLLSGILSVDNLFQYLITIDDENFLRDTLLEKYPLSVREPSFDTFSKLLTILSTSMIAMTPIDTDLGQLNQYFRKVQQSLLILKELSRTTFTSTTDLNTIEDSSKRSRQAAKKKRQKLALPSTLDIKLLQRNGLSIPNTQDEADMVANDLLDDLKSILTQYLSLLKEDLYVDSAATLYFDGPQSTIMPIKQDMTEQPCSEQITSQDDDHLEDSPGSTHEIEAALYHETADGFGQWPVLIESRAIKAFRVLAKKDIINHDIVIKKLRQLSNGHFSRDNQKRLKGADIGVPIFEAKMTRDMRLIYQVHCIPQAGTKGEQQALRVFGVYTHAQMDERLWESLGNQLSIQGSEYRKRCLARQNSAYGPYIYTPLSWPMPSPIEDRSSQNAIGIPQIDREELHRLLVLEKYIPVSQELLDCIIADLDLHHAFVLSSEEQAIMQHSSSCYVLGRSGTGKTVTMVFKMLALERTARNSPGSPRLRQLFVTKSEVLTTRVRKYFSKLMDSYSISNTLESHEIKSLRAHIDDSLQRPLISYAEEERLRSDLPMKFSELTDRHFPLFITFDKLCSLLEGDLISSSSQIDQIVASAYLERMFENEFWPHFPQDLTKGLDPKSVFGEFLGVIEGSELSLHAKDGHLDRETYVNLSHRSFPNFSTKRHLVHDLFIAFAKQKNAKHYYDCADRTHMILRALREKSVPGSKVDYLYVDEVQDNLIIETLLLRMMCSNFRGLFWAGDTAQTISSGSSFKFDELKALMYRAETLHAKDSAYAQPDSFQLSVNYRSHGGIINCAHSVIEIITHIWPYAIDKLKPEIGIVEGAKPFFFSGWETSGINQLDEWLFFANDVAIEFGARQCILVRDYLACDRLHKRIGENANILTLYDSKGLEFDEVLLYDFFQDSPVDEREWRVITKALNDNFFCENTAPAFQAVCRELKFLYVAITRARKTLWIVDHSKNATVMKSIWENRKLIEVCIPGTDVVHLAVSSSKEECEVEAREYFEKGIYHLAMKWFKRAGLSTEATISEAYNFREHAKSTNGHDREHLFSCAGEIFLKCTLLMLGDLAPMVKVYNRLAGECFVESGRHEAAAWAYMNAQEYKLAAVEFAEARMFDETVDILRKHDSAFDLDTRDSLLSMCKYIYLKEGNISKAQGLSDSSEELLEFAADRELNDAHTALLESYGQHIKLAEIYLEEGRAQDVFALPLSDRSDSSRIIGDIILRCFWRLSPLAVVSMYESDRDAYNNLIEMHNVTFSYLETKDDHEFNIFKSLFSHDYVSLGKFSDMAFSIHHDVAAYILASDHLFSDLSVLRQAKADSVIQTLNGYFLYAQEFRKALLKFRFEFDHENTKLLGLSVGDGQEIKVWRSSAVFGLIREWSNLYPTRFQQHDHYISISKDELRPVVRKFCIEHLRQKIEKETTSFRQMKIRWPCLYWVNTGTCPYDHCYRDHITKNDLNLDWFRLRIVIYLRQASILQSLDSVLKRRAQAWQRENFLAQFFEVLQPEFVGFGSCAYLRLLSREDLQSLNYVVEWLKDLYLSLCTAKNTETYLQTFAEYSIFAFDLDDKMASNLAKRFCGTARYIPQFFLRWGWQNVVHELCYFLDPNYRRIRSGVCFLIYVLENRIAMNANALTHLIERACAVLAMACKAYRPYNVHNLTLPISWLLPLLRPGVSPHYPELDVENLFTKVASEFLDLLMTGSDRLLRHKKIIQSTQQRRTFVTRIHTALILWAYNSEQLSLKNRIFEIIKTSLIPRHDRININSPYAFAREWDNLAWNVRLVFGQYPLEKLVHLKLARKFDINMHRPVPGITVVQYNKYAEIQGLLHNCLRESKKDNKQMQVSEIAGDFIVPQIDSGISDSKETLTSNRYSAMESESSYLEDETRSTASEDRSLDTYEVEQIDHDFGKASEEEHNAARTIQDLYRRRLASRQKSSSSTLKKLKLFSEDCLRVTKNLNLLDSKYRKMFLAALPHALFFLHGFESEVQRRKDKVKKALGASAKEFNGFNSELTKLVRIRKLAAILRKELEPDSSLHTFADVRSLQTAFKKLESLVSEYKSYGSLYEDGWHLEIALKVVVKDTLLLESPCRICQRVSEGRISFCYLHQM